MNKIDIELLKEDSIKSFIHLERYVNQRNYSKFCNESYVSEEFTPLNGNENFNLKRLSDLSKVILNSKAKIAREIAKKNLFFVHPDSGYNFEIKETNFKASPTASTRTVLLRNFHKPLFVKTSLPKRISRFKRDLNEQSIRHSLRISKEIKNLCNKTENFACLHEIIGLCYENVGCLFREFNPSPKRKNRMLLPLFSLYSYDYKNPKENLLIEQISKKSKIPIINIIEWVIKNIIEFWCLAIKERGLILEMHAQNTLLELDNKFNPKRIVVRDFCSVGIDKKVRENLGLDLNFSKRLIGVNANFNRKEEYSLVYDYLICHHFLIPLLKICCNMYNLDFEYLKNYTKKIFNKNFPIKNLFTNKCYGYTDEIFVSKKPKLKIFSKKPLLR